MEELKSMVKDNRKNKSPLFDGSQILVTDDLKNQVLSLFPMVKDHSNFKSEFLYRASFHGFDLGVIYQMIAKRGPLLMIFKSEK